MTTARHRPSMTGADEIAGLIEILHNTEQRLAELTRGEVDTVANGHGKVLFLRESQEQHRHAQAVKQAAILDALPAHVALLDQDGVVVGVNAAWRSFARDNGLEGDNAAMGSNYLDVCDRSTGPNATEAGAVASGIRSLLAGEAGRFTMEYPCHSPDEQRWFLLTATPVQLGYTSGAVVMHLDVSTEHVYEEKLRVSEARFRQMADSIGDMFFLHEINEVRMVYVSPAYETIWGRTCQSLYDRPESWYESIHPEDLAATSAIAIAGQTSGRFDLEYRIIRPDGSIRWIEAQSFPVSDAAGRFSRIAGVAKDITERKSATARIVRLSRVHALLSGINTLIIRVRDRKELFAEACRIATDAGLFGLAFVNTVDPDTQEATVVAWNGPNELDRELFRFGGFTGADEVDRPIGRSVHHGQAVICNNLSTDPVKSDLRTPLLANGFASLACLPLSPAGKPDSVLVLGSREVGFFDAEEMQLLRELAGDIAFAMQHIEGSQRANHLAYFDVLTGLGNGMLFEQRLEQAMSAAGQAGQSLALILFDVVRFKMINDSLGRHAGDCLLKELAARMTDYTTESGRLSRLGADQFLVYVVNPTSPGAVAHMIEEGIAAIFGPAFVIGEAVLNISAKFGIAMYPNDGKNFDTLLANAEAALKTAKVVDQPYQFYTQGLNDRVAGKLALEMELRLALERGEFVLFYQPKVALIGNHLTGAEALIRWKHPTRGLVAPIHFIPILEETGLIHEVGKWALQQALADHLRWQAAGLGTIRIAVNVSPLQLRRREFVSQIMAMLVEVPNGANGLEIEITEGVIMEDIDFSVDSLSVVRDNGVTVAIDDFGTGFSSLSYLARLPVDTLKIDRAFVDRIAKGPNDLMLVSTIISLAHSLKLKVVAEGVETEEQANLLRLLRCDEMQGYLFSKPVPVAEFEARFLAAGRAT